MMKSRIARFAGIAAGTAFALTASTAGAQTMSVAQLQAQINALMAQLQALQGGASASVSYTFTRDLTVGSTGADVTALQQFLVSKGYLTMPAGTAYGYFGGLTRAAVARWQAASGVSPAAGYFGAISRAAIAGMMSTGGTTTGGTVSTGNTSGGITTPGKEGVLTVTAGPLSNTVANVGQTMVSGLTIRAQAQNSDIDVQRVTLDLGTNTNIFNKIYNKVYLVDAANGNVLASQNLNSSTVIQSGSDYMVTITGFHFVVPMNTSRDIAVKFDLYSSIDTKYLAGGSSAVNTTVLVPVNGVRGIDGAGIDQFGPSSTFSQALTINASLTDNAQANVSLAPSSPLNSSVPVTDTVNGQLLQVPVMAFNVNAQNDTLHLHQVTVTFTGVRSGNTTATATAAYLYNGSTQIASASINSSTGVATFSNIVDGTAGASIPAGTTVPFTVKADVTGVTAGSLALSASLTTGSTIIYNSQDSTVTISGSATSNTQTVLGKGPAVSLVSSSINKTTTSSNTTSTSTLQATFNVTVQAIGSDIVMGTQASSVPAFVFGVYQNGALQTWGSLAVASTSSFALPTGVVDNGNNSFTIPQNTTVTIPVTISFQGRTTAGAALAFGNYSIGLEAVNYYTSGVRSSLTFMSGQTAWRTTEQVLP